MRKTKPMFRFVVKVIILFVLVAIVLLGLNKSYVEAYPAAINKQISESDKYCVDRILEAKKNPILVCNVGSSHGRDGFNYEDLEAKGIHGANFSLSGQSLSYDYRILQDNIGKLEQGGVVFIPISYFSFYLNETKEPTFDSLNYRYYYFLSPKYIKNYSLKNQLIATFPITGAKDNLFVPFEKKEDDQSSTVGQPAAPEQTLEEKAEIDGAYSAKSHIENYSDQMNPEEVEALKGMIKLLQDKGITPVLVTTPYMIEYRGKIPSQRITDVTVMVTEICAETGVNYYDYSKDIRFDGQYHLFSGAHHLTPEGAKIFVSILFEEVPEIRGFIQSHSK